MEEMISSSSESRATQKTVLTDDSKVFLTGATGLIGGEIAKKLHKVGIQKLWCLLRASGENSNERLMKRLALKQEPAPELTSLTGDLRAPNLGMRLDDLENLRTNVDFIIHCAAETSFIQDRTIHETNIQGTTKVIDFARTCKKNPLLIYISTASNCGKITDACISEELGCRPDGEHINPYTHLPVDAQALLDIVPVDFVADSLRALLCKSHRRYDCYHLSAGRDNAQTTAEWFRFASEYYQTQPVTLIHPAEWTRKTYHQYITTREQRKIFYALRYYLPFMNMNVVFDHSRLAKEIGKPLISPPKAYLPAILSQISSEEAISESLTP